jgi:hypothetical protein
MNCKNFPTIFNEGEIQFAPTYKRAKKKNEIANTLEAKYENVYDYGAKKRTPAWTDRILFASRNNKCVNQLDLVNYDANSEVTLGDHRPVFA